MSVKSAEGVFSVLHALAAAAEPKSASELAHTARLPLTSASRAIATLEAAGFARRVNGAARFELGNAAQVLAYAFMSQFPIRDAALPYLQQLVTVSGVSTSLFVRLGRYAVRVAFIAGTNSVINVNALGEARLLSEGAAGLAMLAHCDLLESSLMPSDSSRESVEARLEEIRSRGHAWEESTLEQGGHDLGVALLDSASKPLACVVLEGVTAELSTFLTPPLQAVFLELQRRLEGDSELLQSHYAHVEHTRIELGPDLSLRAG